ncbi:YfiR family protein [Rugamonas sp. CCM 8940]|uniref:YfiR family protein n=1 Tax=Rugamonas sp. CCM 8940 TaxID=2765359 RepID=UPI0018F45F26|nr:YfiR family protein [Rugamonas sp. CCM 8940]MBJ7312220.1 YfiR family protein [Rugamonas sp. CCM 8940]
MSAAAVAHRTRAGPLAWLLAATLAAPPMAARGDELAALPEQQIKAAYILNFTRYASWPAASFADPRAPLVVCLLGQGSAEIGRELHSRAAGARPLELRTISRGEEAAACHALYISAAEKPRQAALLARLRDQAVLTIGDSAGFLNDGGMINLLLVDGSIRFEVNLTAAKHSGMGLNPRVLGLAERVVGGAAK